MTPLNSPKLFKGYLKVKWEKRTFMSINYLRVKVFTTKFLLLTSKSIKKFENKNKANRQFSTNASITWRLNDDWTTTVKH